jgi:hypothetical protein
MGYPFGCRVIYPAVVKEAWEDITVGFTCAVTRETRWQASGD